VSFVESLDKSINNASKILTTTIFDGEMYIIANNIRQVIRPIAISILGLCFVIEFLKVLINADILKWETGVKIGAKLTLTYVALDISSLLMEAIYATGNDLITNVAKTTSNVSSLVNANLRASLERLNVVEVFAVLASVGVAFIIVWLSGIVILVVAFARTIELLLHIAVAPIPCAFLILESHRGSSIVWKFIMSFAAKCLQGFFIVLSIALYNKLVRDVLDIYGTVDLASIAGNLVLGAVILVVCVVKSGTLAKQILDA